MSRGFRKSESFYLAAERCCERAKGAENRQNASQKEGGKQQVLEVTVAINTPIHPFIHPSIHCLPINSRQAAERSRKAGGLEPLLSETVAV